MPPMVMAMEGATAMGGAMSTAMAMAKIDGATAMAMSSATQHNGSDGDGRRDGNGNERGDCASGGWQ
jgi:hypothetical protein